MTDYTFTYTDDENDSSNSDNSSDEERRNQHGHMFVLTAAYLLMTSVERTSCRTSTLQACTQRILAERFQQSNATVHKCVKTTVRALVKLGNDIIRPHNRGLVQPEISRNKKYYPYFEKCIGAIDGTHVAAWTPTSKQKIYRGRKGSIVTQNVMVICSFDMMFTYVHARWEGSANDSRVFIDAITKPEYGFPMPTQGYPNIIGFLALYRGESYHLN